MMVPFSREVAHLLVPMRALQRSLCDRWVMGPRRNRPSLECRWKGMVPLWCKFSQKCGCLSNALLPPETEEGRDPSLSACTVLSMNAISMEVEHPIRIPQFALPQFVTRLGHSSLIGIDSSASARAQSKRSSISIQLHNYAKDSEVCSLPSTSISIDIHQDDFPPSTINSDPVISASQR